MQETTFKYSYHSPLYWTGSGDIVKIALEIVLILSPSVRSLYDSNIKVDDIKAEDELNKRPFHPPPEGWDSGKAGPRPPDQPARRDPSEGPV